VPLHRSFRQQVLLSETDMSSDPNPSAQGARLSQPINPYQASGVESATSLAVASADRSTRSYQARLDWADRATLLRSLLPLRIAVVASSVVWFGNLFEMTRLWGDAVLSDPLLVSGPAGMARALFAVVWFAQGVLCLYLCWLNWRYANAVQDVAGGATNSFRAWSRQYFRLEWLSAVSAVLWLAQEAAGWAFDRWETGQWGGL
jgi:hypothetical protein